MASILKQSLMLLHSQQQSVINQLSSRALATVAKKYVFSRQFVGEPKPTDFTLVEEPLPALKDGGNNIFNNVSQFNSECFLDF